MKFALNAYAVFLLSLLGCRPQAVEPEPATIVPRFGAVQISANLHNVLSAIAEVRVEDAQSVAIEYGADSLFQHSTPMVQVDGTSARLPVLGLEAHTKYFMRARARAPAGHYSISTTQSFTTSPLPNDFTSICAHQ